MLVLTRRKNQSIVIGDGIVVTVLEVQGDNIRLGITAPRHVQVYREELLTALTAANTSAVLVDSAAAATPPAPAAAGSSAGSAGSSAARLPARRRRVA